MRLFTAKTLACVGTLTAVLSWADLANADSIFVTPPGATEPITGEPVSAGADFSLSGTTLTLTLTNTLPGIRDAGQLLTDVFFVLAPDGTQSLSTQTGDLISVAKDGSVTNNGSAALGWGFGSATVNGSDGFEVCVICQGGPAAPATPSEGIIGPASADGLYDNANGSIAGNKPHNPFVNQTAVFTITGFSPDTTFGNVIFSFSTTSGDNVPGVPGVVPEPSMTWLLGAFLAVGLVVLRRRQFHSGRVK